MATTDPTAPASNRLLTHRRHVDLAVPDYDRQLDLSWTFEEMVAYASPGTWVRPVDVLGSGTCRNGGRLAELWGVRGRRDPAPLKPGDTVTLTVENIGSVSNTVVAGPDPVPVPVARRRPGKRPAPFPGPPSASTASSSNAGRAGKDHGISCSAQMIFPTGV